MVKRTVIAKKAKRGSGNSPRLEKMANIKYLGLEPKFDSTPSNVDYTNALTWYSYMADIDDRREYLSTWLKENNRPTDAIVLDGVPDCWINATAAAIARMLSMGSILSESSVNFLNTKLTEMLSRVKKVEPTVPAAVISIQQRVKERQSEILAEIEGLIDSGQPFSLYDWLKSKEIPATYCPAIIAKYAPWLDDMIGAYEKDDEQLIEGYRHLSKKQLHAQIIAINQMIADAEKYGAIVKKERKPRKKRPVTAEKVLKHFKYQKNSNDYKIASINPERIIGAQELWVFNTKYKIISVFRANGPKGLSVKRTAIIGFDPTTSHSKGSGRKTEEILEKIRNGGKVALRRVIDEIKTSKPLQVRINENSVLLRVGG